VRRRLLVNALIFAVLAAAVALAYYGYSFVVTDSSHDRELQLMREITADKVNNIESRILSDDDKLFSVPLEDLTTNLDRLASTVHVVSVFVLDEHRTILPSGYASARSGKEGAEFRHWFEHYVLPTLPLASAGAERGHVHLPPSLDTWDGRGKLFSFKKGASGDKTYYVVIEEDLSYLLALVFPQYFSLTGLESKRIYQIVDANDELIYGPGWHPDPGALQEHVPFPYTVDGWFVRVSEKDDSARKEARRKRVVDSVFVGGAVVVLAAGLTFLVFAIRRERRANELKSEFISNVSHELKTPLSIISMFGEMLANGRTKGPDQATEYAEIIWRESVRLTRLIDNVLDFAKIERGRGMYEFAEADVGEVVERAVDLIGRRLATADMTIAVSIEPELPLVQVDANALTLAVMNLIDNATKYAADGKKIELTMRREPDRIVLDVRDFGPGIDVDEQEHIFERFYRARAVRLKPIRGSGIGLALVRHIARAHRGDVQVVSTPGQGSTFRLWLPI